MFLLKERISRTMWSKLPPSAGPKNLLARAAIFHGFKTCSTAGSEMSLLMELAAGSSSEWSTLNRGGLPGEDADSQRNCELVHHL